MNRTTIAVTAAAVLLSAAAASAGPIHRRQERQAGRIHQGVESGALTPGEAHGLRGEQRSINQDRRRDLADGHLSPGEAAQLTREQDQASRDIYRLKHNDRTVNP